MAFGKSGAGKLARQQAAALAAQQAQAQLASQDLSASDKASVQAGGTADANAAIEQQPLKKKKTSLSGSLGINT